ncbi:hypothetical protein PROFUN_12724 [Planoprotostelium fungivorum]|uniref:Uncharacterized protein n=1 Tax=Planoprotostelium fungivorum TaxID=1890364 RepID=A0A2P6N6G8_9EUKA|nr:hypothetical protein PROFUN_12724 [Planoprotostelium fungivorum]
MKITILRPGEYVVSWVSRMLPTHEVPGSTPDNYWLSHMPNTHRVPGSIPGETIPFTYLGHHTSKFIQSPSAAPLYLAWSDVTEAKVKRKWFRPGSNRGPHAFIKPSYGYNLSESSYSRGKHRGWNSKRPPISEGRGFRKFYTSTEL